MFARKIADFREAFLAVVPLAFSDDVEAAYAGIVFFVYWYTW